MIDMPHDRGFTSEEMPEELQEEIDRRVEVYSDQVLENGSVDGKDAALFYVGEGTMFENILDNLDYTNDADAIMEGNMAAIAIERVAEQVLESTETAIVYDKTTQETVYQEELDSKTSYDKHSALNIVKAIGEHYEDVEFEQRAKQHLNEFEESCRKNPELEDPETVVDTYRELIQSSQKQEEDLISHPSRYAALEKMCERSSDPKTSEKVFEIHNNVEINEKPVFATTVHIGYLHARYKQMR